MIIRKLGEANPCISGTRCNFASLIWYLLILLYRAVLLPVVDCCVSTNAARFWSDRRTHIKRDNLDNETRPSELHRHRENKMVVAIWCFLFLRSIFFLVESTFLNMAVLRRCEGRFLMRRPLMRVKVVS